MSIMSKNKKAKNNVVKPVDVAEKRKESVIYLLDDDKEKVLLAEGTLRDIKLKLADLELNYQSRKNELFQQFVEAEKQLLQLAKETAIKYGIDPDADPKDGVWTLKTSEMCFKNSNE